MRVLAAGLSLAVMMWAQTAPAAPDATGIAFRDILETLAAKVQVTADVAFFENEVLRGKARRLTPVSSDAVHFEYAYEPEGSGSQYSEVKDGNTATVTFSANAFAKGPCVTIKEAQNTLKAHGWSRSERVNPGDAIRETYARKSVSLAILNAESLAPPTLESWNPTEMNDRLMADYRAQEEKIMAQRRRLKPGTKDYDGLCVNMLRISFTR